MKARLRPNSVKETSVSKWDSKQSHNMLYKFNQGRAQCAFKHLEKHLKADATIFCGHKIGKFMMKIWRSFMEPRVRNVADTYRKNERRTKPQSLGKP